MYYRGNPHQWQRTAVMCTKKSKSEWTADERNAKKSKSKWTADDWNATLDKVARVDVSAGSA